MGLLFDVTQVERGLDRLLAYTYPCVDISPIILISNPDSRSRRTDGYAQLLDDIDETHNALVRIEEQLAEVKLRLRQRRAILATALVPVSGLPTEVLRQIFTLVAESDRTSRACIGLSHVSSAWRAASIGLTELWTVIQVPEACPDMVHEFAARSRDLPLELYRLQDRHWPADLDLTPEVASRLSIMSSAPSEGPTPSVFGQSLMRHSAVTRLDTLDMSGLSQSIIGGMASARALRVSNSTIDPGLSIRMERLVDLSVESVLNTDLSALMGSLQAPLLRHVTLSRIWIHMEPHRFPAVGREWEYMDNLSAQGIREEEDETGRQNFENEVVARLISAFPHEELASHIASLALDRCHFGFMISILRGWRMFNLTSLKLVLSNEHASDQYIVQYWRSREGTSNFTRYTPDFHGHLYDFVRLLAICALPSCNRR